MRNLFLIGVGGFSVVTAAYIWTSPQHWYNTIPGVGLTGPMNVHFAKDVALAYLTSGAALIWAGVRRDRPVGLFGAAWPVFHAVFHIWIWIHRGAPVDLVAMVNLTGIQIPAFAGLILALGLPLERKTP